MSEGDSAQTSGAAASSSFVTSRPVAVLMLFIAAVVFGFFSYGRLPVTLMPELSYPTITVRTEYPGAAPEEVENDISRPIEEALGVVGGLQKISSVSRAEVSDVILEFDWDTDIPDATQSVLERLDLVFLPDEARRPLILHFDPELDPVMELSLSGEGAMFEGEPGLRRLRRIAELQLKRQLEPIRGIAAVRVKGGLEEEIHVLLEEEQLRRTGLSIQTVIDRLRQENINVAGGTIREGRTEYLVRTLNEYENISQIGETIVAEFNGRKVRIQDLGRVEMTHRERQIMTRTDGLESVQIEILKEADANIVALAHRVKDEIGSIEPKPTGLAGDLWTNENVKLQVTADRSLFIESSISEVRNTAVLGGLLAILVLYLFLREARTTAIIGVSIPISLVITFAPLHLFGATLNIMSLGGLALGIGMLVDSSIVVLESIHRCREEGDDLVSAAIRGTDEVRSAVVSSTLTSIAVFFPMVFVEGVAGQAFGDLGMAVVVSLLASVAVAVWFVPMLASRRGVALEGEGGGASRLFKFGSLLSLRSDFRRMPRWAKLLPPVWLYQIFRTVLFLLIDVLTVLGKLLFLSLSFALRYLRIAIGFVFYWLLYLPARANDALLGFSLRAYPRALGFVLGNRSLVFITLVIVGFGVVQLGRSMESELLPEVRQGEFTFELALPVGTPLEESDRILRPLEAAILAERENIRSVLLTVGFDPTQSQRSDEGEHTARFKILIDAGAGGAREDRVAERLRRRFHGIPDLDSRLTRPVLFSSKTPIEVEIHGDDLRQLKKFGDKVAAILSELPELSDVQSTLHSGAPEMQVLYDREKLMLYGLNIRGVAEHVRDKVQGYEATRFNMLDRRIPIVARLDQNDRESVAQVERLVVNPGGERPIQLTAVADVKIGEGPSEVRRIDGRRVAVIRANLRQGSLGGAVEKIEETLRAKVDWPTHVNYFISGQNEEWKRSEGSLYLALGLSIFLVYVIMAVQFESLVHPFVIMFTIPLAFIGTIVVLKLLGIALSIVVFLGMIMLAGIVVNNAIVLVDYINQLRRRGLERDAAITEAGIVRLRPILMTTATTVLGLLPMALGLGDGAEIRTPMALAVISGLISSTFLTLLVIPTVYATLDDLLLPLRNRQEQKLAEPTPGRAMS
jgi:HAE1 family hydrophobic/amphiphilic exporter-1